MNNCRNRHSPGDNFQSLRKSPQLLQQVTRVTLTKYLHFVKLNLTKKEESKTKRSDQNKVAKATVDPI